MFMSIDKSVSPDGAPHLHTLSLIPTSLMEKED